MKSDFLVFVKNSWFFYPPTLPPPPGFWHCDEGMWVLGGAQEKGFSGPGTRGSVSLSEGRGCWGWARLSQALVGRRLWNLQLVRNDTKCFPIRTLGQCLCSLSCSHTHALGRSFLTGPETAKDQGLHSQNMYWAPSRSLTLCPGHTDQQDMHDSWLHKAYTLVGGTSQKQTITQF